jgi:serine/threonine protein kinase
MSKELRHPSVVALYGITNDGPDLFLVAEWCPHTFSVLLHGNSHPEANLPRNQKRRPIAPDARLRQAGRVRADNPGAVAFPLRTRLQFAQGLAQGVCFLHARDIVHRDIKVGASPTPPVRDTAPAQHHRRSATDTEGKSRQSVMPAAHHHTIAPEPATVSLDR